MKAFFRFGRSRKKAEKLKVDEPETSSSTAGGATTSGSEAGTPSEAAGATTSGSEARTPSKPAGATTIGRATSRDFEVFLNFRGPDSRHTVVNVLYDALDRAGIRVFYDDESIRQGYVIEGELQEAIIKSKIYIPIFSKDYASSRWCLRELQFILCCWEASQEQDGEKKTILPIFYDVDVSTDLKLKSELYNSALQKHKNKLGDSVVMPWENALRKAAKIKGRDIRNHGLTELTKLIVDEVCCTLYPRSDLEVLPHDYVAMDDPMKDIMRLLDLDVNDVRFVTIYAMGGVGKSTLAKLVFNRISSSFGQRVAFLLDVREKFHTVAGILDLQKDLISRLLGVRSLPFLHDVDDGVSMIKDRLQDKKVLIILDDIDKRDQLLKLAGETCWFGVGSRIIVTTRDIGEVPEHEGFYRYKMQEMKHDDALKLFSERVFKSDSPPWKYEEISRVVIETIGRLPLAIKVIAPLFTSKSKDAWQGILEKLKKVVHKDVREKLMLSYEKLDYYEREIFLDIACLFINKEIEDATHYWEARDCHPVSGIRVLKNMSLIEIEDGNRIWMHDLLRDLGRNLVDEETDIHGKRSRLWSPEVALNVVRRKKGTEKVVALKLGELDAGCTFNLTQFAGLTNLKFLELNGGSFTNEDFVEVFSELRWLSWDDCPAGFRLTPLWLYNVVVLILSENLITDDWDGWHAIGQAKKLKVLKCTYCRFLTKSPEFGTFNLERLVFKNCANLREIDPSIGRLERLTYLEVSNPLIYKERLPDEYISYQLEQRQAEILPLTIGMAKSLSVLKLKFVNLSELPHEVGLLENLKYLCLWCPELKELPESIGDLKSLIELDISFTAIAHLPNSVMHLESLVNFEYENSQLIRNDADRIGTLITSNRWRSLRQMGWLGSYPSQGFDPIGTERIESLKNK